MHIDSIDDSAFDILGYHLKSYINAKSRSFIMLGKTQRYLEKGSGLPVILLHGFACNKSIWRGVMGQLNTEQFRVISPDIPGFNFSKADPSVSYSGRFFVNWLDEFLDALAIDQCHLLAHSAAVMRASNPGPALVFGKA